MRDCRCGAASPLTVAPRWRGAVVVGVAGTGVWLAMRPAPPGVSRLQITPPTAAALTTAATIRDVAITPDGTRVIYTGINDTLVVRALDQLDPTPLTLLGTTPQGPFVSPDGQWIGFVTGGNTNLKKVSITGGPAVMLAQVARTQGQGPRTRNGTRTKSQNWFHNLWDPALAGLVRLPLPSLRPGKADPTSRL